MKLTKDLATIIYYTSNREDEVFENNIRKRLLAVSGDLPIVSVSQKPIDFGTNICVGEVGVNDDNLYRQILIACQNATTPFVISAEADELYPPDYFDFVPPSLTEVYDYPNVWVLKEWEDHYYKKEKTEGARIVGREHYIKIIETALAGLPMWNPANSWDYLSSKEYCKMKLVIKTKYCKQFPGDLNPVVSIKTNNGMRKTARGIPGIDGVQELPYWGNATNLIKELNEAN